MKIIKLICSSLITVMCVIPWHANALIIPVLEAGTNTLLGIQGIEVGSNQYDVSFVDGKCEDIFSDCNDSSDFTFTDQSSALAAMQALLNVFEISLPVYNDNPELTFGCTNILRCQMLTPYSPHPSNSDFALFAQAQNTKIGGANFLSGFSQRVFYDSSGTSYQVFAKWTPSVAGTINEPVSIFMLGFAVVFIMRKRKG